MCKKDYPDILEELEKEPFNDLLDAGCGPAPMISLLSEKLTKFLIIFHKLVNADISRILGLYRYFLLEDTLHKLAFTSMKMQPKVVNE